MGIFYSSRQAWFFSLQLVKQHTVAESVGPGGGVSCSASLALPHLHMGVYVDVLQDVA